MITLFSITLTGLTSYAENEFYECTLPQAEEFRVGIDINKQVAGFFDNDSTSIMNYIGFRESTSSPGHDVLIYQGKDQGGDGDLKLEFNTSTKRIKISTVETDGTIELLGFSQCNNSSPWDLEPTL